MRLFCDGTNDFHVSETIPLMPVDIYQQKNLEDGCQPSHQIEWQYQQLQYIVNIMVSVR